MSGDAPSSNGEPLASPGEAGWADRRSPDRPQFIEGWRKAVRNKVAQAQASAPIAVQATGHIDIWLAGPDALMLAHSSQKLLSEDDWQTIYRLQDPARRRSAIASRIMLRIALSRAAEHKVQPSEWRFVVDAKGRPAVTEGLPPIKFSVSDLDQIVVVAVSVDREIGIDVECIDQNISKDVIAGFTHLDEQHSVGGLPRPQEIREFVRLWTLKEAYTKLVGSGHSLDFKSIKFTLDPVKLTAAGNQKDGATQFENFYISNKHLLFHTSLAIRHPPRDAGATDVQLISLAGTEGRNGNQAAPVAR